MKLVIILELYCLYSSLSQKLILLFYVDVDLFSSLIRSLPIWPVLSDPFQQDAEPPLKSASCGHILPKYFKHYRTKNTRIYLAAKDDLDRRIFTDLNVPMRDIYSYTFEDVEFPNECDLHYLNFLNGILR